MNPEEQKILYAINQIEGQRHILGDAIVDAALVTLNQNLNQLKNINIAAHSGKEIFMEGERKLVTIMFADFSNFTAMSEKMDAEDVRTVMNDCFSKLVPIVEQYGGTVDKFIGDEIMALFGAPIAHDNDAEYALRAALDMMKALEEFNIEHHTSLGLHFGINTGIVVTGGVGSIERQQYSVIGDPVNLAARLEDASLTGEILVGHETYRITAAVFNFEERAPISVKGKEDPVFLYRLLGLKSTPLAVRGIEGMHSEMVGREKPFHLLMDAIENLKNNLGNVCALVAEPGIGKTRMLKELRNAATYNKWIEGRSQSYTQNISYGLAKSILDNALEVPMNSTMQEVGEIMLDQLSKLVPKHAYELFPYLALLRGIKLDEATESFLRSVTPEVMQLRIRRSFADFLIAISFNRPTVLVCEDIHWTDASSLQLIEYLFQIVHGKPILILLTFRPQEGLVQDYHKRWLQSSEDYTVVKLSPLTKDDSKLLLENLLGITNLPDNTREVIFQKAEGNPFYLEELLRSLLDAGLLYWHEGQIKLKNEIEHLKIPNTLQGVIESRIDRLNPEEKITLQTASVIGRIFGLQILEYLIESEKKVLNLLPALNSLQDRELIRKQIALDYIFKHAVTQDITYNSLLLAKRRKLHHIAAEAIEILFPDQNDELSAILAWHYQLARNHKKAAYYLTIEADKSRLTYSHLEAEHFYREALKEIELVKDRRWNQKTEIYEHLGEVLVLLSRFDDARQTFLEAITILPHEESIVKARLYRKIGESFAIQRRPDQELVQYNLAMQILGESKVENLQNWQHEWLEIQLAKIWSLYWLNQTTEMNQTLDMIHSICENTGTVRQQSILYLRWVTYFFRKEQYAITPAQAAYAEKALALSYEALDYKLITQNTGLLGMALLGLNELEKAETKLLESIELSQKIGDIHMEVVGLQFLNVVYMYKNNIEAVRKWSRIMEEKATGKMPFYLCSVKGFYGWLALKENNLEEVEKQALEALKIHNNAPVPTFIIKWPLIAAYVIQKRYGDAIHQLKDLLLPYQKKIKQEVEDVIHKAIIHWDNNETDAAQIEINKVFILAQENHYF